MIRRGSIGERTRGGSRQGPPRRLAETGRALLMALALLSGWLISTASAQSSDEVPASPPVAKERPIMGPTSESTSAQDRPLGTRGPGLDALLHVPSRVLEGTSSAVAGTSEDEWRRRFEKTRSELEAARTGLEQTKRELDSVAEGGGANQWSVAPPGGGGTGAGATSPLSFRLRQELKRNRDRLEAAERSLRELRIEADLAGVPASWRGDPVASSPRSLPN